MIGGLRKAVSIRRRARLFVLVAALMAGEVAMHTLLARAYYDLNLKRLQLIAVMAATAGAEHLPGDPGMAVRVARSCARFNGIGRDEIVFVRASSDDQVLTVRLDRRIPSYLALFVVGLPARDMTVTASARSLAANGQLYALAGFQLLQL